MHLHWKKINQKPALIYYEFVALSINQQKEQFKTRHKK
jgi:hypothetical protein